MVSYMIRKINDLADIYTGQSIRGKISHKPSGEYCIVQMRDVSPQKSFKKADLCRMDLKSGTPKLIKKGDLLFISKAGLGTTPFSIVVKEEITNLIASPLFYIIRVKSNEVHPEHLNWYINSSSQSRRFFKKNAMGTMVLNVRKETLSEMEVILPPLPIQETFVELIKLVSKEHQIMDKIYQKRKQLMDSIIANSFLTEGEQI